MALRQMAPIPQQLPSPARLFVTINAYQDAAVMKAAVELGLFTVIQQGAHTAREIAARCQALERGVRIVCDFLTVQGWLAKSGDQYRLMPEAEAFLVRTSPAYMGDSLGFLLAPELVRSFDDLAGIVRNGVPADEMTVKPENPLWVEFARNMAGLMKLPAKMIADYLGAGEGRKWKVLDIAAGHGVFGITIAAINPNAQVVALDWRNVLQVAKDNAGKAGVSARYSVIEGSAFEAELGAGYDVVLLTNFLHHFDYSTCVGLLKKVHAAMAPAGRVATLEFVPNEDRVSPAMPARFAVQMLRGTPGGEAYTFSELSGMFKDAGFARSERYAMEPTLETLVISYR